MIKVRAAQLGLALAAFAATDMGLLKAAHLTARYPTPPNRARPAQPEIPGGECSYSQTSDVSAASPGARATAHNHSKTDQPKHPTLATFVLLVSLDGMRADAVYPHTGILKRIALEGASATTALTIPESVTLPAHASMVSGVGVKKHRIGYDAFQLTSPHIGFRTIFSAAHDAGLSTAMFIGKRKLQVLDDAGSVDRVEFSGMFCTPIVQHAAPYLRTAPPGVVFVHFPDLDSAGHRYGWMSEKYLRAARRTERCLDQLVEAVQARGDLSRFLLVVTADHGGHGRMHGTRRREDRQIPWLLWGGASASQTQLSRSISVTDTAATILYALGLDPPTGIEGRAVFELLAHDTVLNERTAVRAHSPQTDRNSCYAVE